MSGAGTGAAAAATTAGTAALPPLAAASAGALPFAAFSDQRTAPLPTLTTACAICNATLSCALPSNIDQLLASGTPVEAVITCGGCGGAFLVAIGAGAGAPAAMPQPPPTAPPPPPAREPSLLPLPSLISWRSWSSLDGKDWMAQAAVVGAARGRGGGSGGGGGAGGGGGEDGGGL
jgi:uncharacterized membrane protein YgcG